MADFQIASQSHLCARQFMPYVKGMAHGSQHGTSLAGKLLIAMPTIHDPNFEHSVVFVCAHTNQGAMGLVINKPAPLMFFSDILDKVDIGMSIESLPDDLLRLPVRLGGPVEQFRGFVLHSTDYDAGSASLHVAGHFALTATIDILKDIALGNGPARKLIALGYSGWAPGQLESEIQANGWLYCDPDAELLFTDDLEAKHVKALAKIGVSPGSLSSDVGHA